MARPSGRPIRDELIVNATALIQEVGVTGFSYGDLAKSLGIKAPSIHHHFGAKEDLVAAVAAKYRNDFADAVAEIDDADADAVSQILDYARLFARTAETDNLCLCGAVSADWLAVGEKSRAEVQLFFNEQQSWLEQTLQRGNEANEISAALPIPALAIAILSMLEGSLLVARANGNADLPVETVQLLTKLLTSS